MANHYVRDGATGTADGSDWTNAWDDLPASLTRGDTYYIADGNYTNYVFDDELSGATYIYIKKATASAHGTETGWSSAYGDGQAVFQNNTEIVWNIARGYYDFDGVVGSGTSGHGIKVYTTQNNENEPGVYIVNGSTAHNLLFKHIEIQGPDHGSSNTTRNFFDNSTDSDNLTFQYCYFHEAGKTWVTLAGDNTNVLIERCYFKNCGSNDVALHCCGIAYYATTNINLTIRYNVFKDMIGPLGISGYIEPQGTGGSGVYIYGNVFIGSDVNELGVCLLYTSTEYGAVEFYNNTIYGFHDTNPGFNSNVAGTDAICILRNNIWQNCSNAPAFPHCTESNNEKNTAAATFVNVAGEDFHLSAETDAGLDVGSPFDIDPDGVTRGAGAVWDLGAYEYVDASTPYVRIY